MREQEIINNFKSSLKQLLPIDGLSVKPLPKPKLPAGVDLAADVRFEKLQFEMIIEVVAGNSLPILRNKIGRLKAFADQKRDAVPVLVAPYLSPERQELCQNEGVDFIDLSGNVHLQYKSLYIDKRGLPNRFPEKRYGRNPFSDKASLILRALLEGKEQSWGIRALAHKIGLDPGFVSRMAKENEDRGYVARLDSKLRLRSVEGMLDDWVRSYSLKKNKHSRYFCMAESAGGIIDKIRQLAIADGVQYALSVQAGASLVAPLSSFKEVHVYVSSERDAAFFEKALALTPAERGANLILMRPYYKNSVYYGSRIIDGLRVVSDIQLYLDLYGYPIRGLEQAEHILNHRIKPEHDGIENR